MTNKKIASALAETASLIELTGGNAFRARALAGAARTIRGLQDSAAQRLEQDTLTEIDGIGDGLAAQIGELIDRGSFELRDDLLNAVPPGLPALLRIKGLGTKKVRQLWKELDITSLEELETAAESGALLKLDGFGTKTQSKIIKNIRLHRQYSARRRINEAWILAESQVDHLRAHDPFTRVEIAGDLRRNMETVDRLEFVAAVSNLDQPHLAPEGFSPVERDWPGYVSARHYRIEVDESFPVYLAVVSEESFGTALWHATGSSDHREVFIAHAGAPESNPTEKQVFGKVNLGYIPPEIREGMGEVEAAAKQRLPELITVNDLRGTLHNHSTYSDGVHSLRTMADYAQSMGLSYFGICDHSQSLTIASGLTVAEIEQQQIEINELNAEFEDRNERFKIFSGIESDILPDGSLDYPVEILESFDFIVGSIHSRFNMSQSEATERLVTAISNPYTSILGHATGRLLLGREGYEVDHERVIEACAEHNVAIELNANPHRLDMDWRFLKKATDRGVLISINPDAHSTAELEHVKWGVAVARKAWLTAEQCLNAFPLNSFEEWIADQAASR